MSAADAARRLVADVQRLGLHSTSAVVDRYAVAVEQALGLDPSVPTPSDGGLLVDAAARMAQAYLSLLDGLAGLAGAAPRATDRVEVVHLPAAPPGASTTVSVWVHNGTADPIDTEVRLGTLERAGGGALPDGALTVTPRAVAVLAGGRAEVVLRAVIPPGQPPGSYLGLALAPGAHPVALLLDVGEEAEP